MAGELPQYEPDSSDSEAESAPLTRETTEEPNSTSQYTFQPPVEYTRGSNSYSNYIPDANNHYKCDKYTVYGLSASETLVIRGCFQFQILKGGIKYNNVHYSASKSVYRALHPVCNSIPVISASHYAGWEETAYKDSACSSLFQDFQCCIKIWELPTGIEKSGFKVWAKGNMSYSLVLHPDPVVNTVDFDPWVPVLDTLSSSHTTSPFATKIVTVGAKNSGKSTFMKLALQNMCKSGETVHVLDLDPGQPEFSKPDCISLSQLDGYQFGNHLSLTREHISASVNHYVGYTSPKDQPLRYLALCDDLISIYNQEGAPKQETAIVNLPGWIKGFGMEILNHIMASFQPTHVVFLESSKVTASDYKELALPQETEVLSAKGSFHQGNIKFHASQMRQMRLMSYFHKQDTFKFDFQPLLNRSPYKISYGRSGIVGIAFSNDYGGLHSDDIVAALEATVVGLYIKGPQPLVPKGDHPLPVVALPSDGEFKCLAIVHSINTVEKYINMYIPGFEGPLPLNKDWVIVRAQTELPVQIMYPNPLKDAPYITLEQAAKHEHVWKVRKNVQRRGHK